MTRLFFDTSALAKRYAQEPGTGIVDDLVEAPGTTVVITSLTVVELASALRRKRNRGQLLDDEVDRLLSAFFRETIDRFTLIALDETRFERALDLVLEDDLRTLDSLQLSAALDVTTDLEVAFVCADRELVAAATERGLEAIDPTAEDPLRGTGLEEEFD